LRLAVDSRLETAVVVRPVRFQVPSYKIYKYEPSEVEVRIIRRFIKPGYEYADLEIELITFRNICPTMHTLELHVRKVNTRCPDQTGS
jgi:hypothetical protein